LLYIYIYVQYLLGHSKILLEDVMINNGSNRATVIWILPTWLEPWLHCPRVGPGQGWLIFANPGPDPQGLGQVRAGSGPTLGPAIFRQV
jgi:hypothetical protein